MVRLSLSMIVKNEAQNLAHCLDSVRDLVDEMVILDTGSTDGTVEIARGYGACVESFTWIDDFAAARNACLEHCTGDWILVLDADEAIDSADHAAIRTAIESTSAQGLMLWMRNYLRTGAFMGCSGEAQANDGHYREGSTFSHHISRRALRLFRRQGEPVYRGRVHELAETYFDEHHLPLEDLEAVIHHYGKTDMDRDMAKQAEYTRMAKAEAAARPEDLDAHYNVIQEGLMIEDWAAVLASAKAFLALRDRAPLLVYLGAAMACQGLGRSAEALDYLQPVLAQEPDHPAALCVKGEALASLGRTAVAQQALLAAMEQNPAFTLPFLKLAELLERCGDLENARSVLEAGLDQNPKDLVLWTHLVALSARKAPDRVAADAWDAIQAVPDGGKGVWHLIVAHHLLASGAQQEACLVLERGLAVFPDHAELRAALEAARIRAHP